MRAPGAHDVIMTVSSVTCQDLRAAAAMTVNWPMFRAHDIIMTVSSATCLDLMRSVQMNLNWPMRVQGINTAQTTNEELVYQKLKLHF